MVFKRGEIVEEKQILKVNVDYEHGYMEAVMYFQGTIEELIKWFRKGVIPGNTYLRKREELMEKYGVFPLENPAFFLSEEEHITFDWDIQLENPDAKIHAHEEDDSYLHIKGVVYPYIPDLDCN